MNACARCGSKSEDSLDETEGFCATCFDWARASRFAPAIARIAEAAIRDHENRHHRRDEE